VKPHPKRPRSRERPLATWPAFTNGAMRTDGNLGRTPTYFPNSRGEWTDQPDLNEPPLEIEGAAAHWDHRVDDDHYQQPGDLFRKMNAAQRQALFDNTARAVGGAAVHIQERHIANCAKADPEYGAGVAAALVRLAGGNPATDDRQSA
jgi:catalase